MKAESYDRKLFLVVLVAFTVITFIVSNTKAEFKFRNIKCQSLDENFTTFEYCYLKAVNRSYGYMSLKAKLLQVPINNVTINWSLHKRANGYRPFLFNLTMDGCKLIRLQKSSPVISYFYSFISSHSNLNHSCPYNHDIIVDKLDNYHMNNKFSEVLPMPPGTYALYTIWYVHGIERATVNVYADNS